MRIVEGLRGRVPMQMELVMAWVVFDRGVRFAEQFDLEAPLDRWKQVRGEIHQEICEQGYDRERRTFTQYYGSKELDASISNLGLTLLSASSTDADEGEENYGT
jgi:GH15 family glucan-1,4-alpha-glucosidase